MLQKTNKKIDDENVVQDKWRKRSCGAATNLHGQRLHRNANIGLFLN